MLMFHSYVNVYQRVSQTKSQLEWLRNTGETSWTTNEHSPSLLRESTAVAHCGPPSSFLARNVSWTEVIIENHWKTIGKWWFNGILMGF